MITPIVMSAIMVLLMHRRINILNRLTIANRKISIFNRMGYINNESRKLIFSYCGSLVFNSFFFIYKQNLTKEHDKNEVYEIKKDFF